MKSLQEAKTQLEALERLRHQYGGDSAILAGACETIRYLIAHNERMERALEKAEIKVPKSDTEIITEDLPIVTAEDE